MSFYWQLDTTSRCKLTKNALYNMRKMLKCSSLEQKYHINTVSVTKHLRGSFSYCNLRNVKHEIPVMLASHCCVSLMKCAKPMLSQDKHSLHPFSFNHLLTNELSIVVHFYLDMWKLRCNFYLYLCMHAWQRSQLSSVSTCHLWTYKKRKQNVGIMSHGGEISTIKNLCLLFQFLSHKWNWKKQKTKTKPK